MELNRVERMLMALLRYSLCGEFDNRDMAFFTGVSRDEWDACYLKAARHGVRAVAWDGVMMLPEELRGYDDLRIMWFLDVEQYEGTYRYFCQVASELTELYRQHGIGTVVLKGVGFSTYYPTPSHREGGDIDIYTYSLDRSVMTDARASDLADELMVSQGIEVDSAHPKHSVFTYKDVMIENHKNFIDVGTIRGLEVIEMELHKVLHPRTVKVDGRYELSVPSAEFNYLFIGMHAAMHYTCGLSLHHLYDWACILRSEVDGKLKVVEDERLDGFVKALTYLSHEWLGSAVGSDCDRVLADEVLDSILHFPYDKEVMPRDTWGIIRFKLARNLYRWRHRRKVFSAPLYAIIYGMVRHLRRGLKLWR